MSFKIILSLVFVLVSCGEAQENQLPPKQQVGVTAVHQGEQLGVVEKDMVLPSGLKDLKDRLVANSCKIISETKYEKINPVVIVVSYQCPSNNINYTTSKEYSVSQFVSLAKSVSRLKASEKFSEKNAIIVDIKVEEAGYFSAAKAILTVKFPEKK